MNYFKVIENKRLVRLVTDPFVDLVVALVPKVNGPPVEISIFNCLFLGDLLPAASGFQLFDDLLRVVASADSKQKLMIFFTN